MHIPRLVFALVVLAFVVQTAAPANAQYPRANEEREKKDKAEAEAEQLEETQHSSAGPASFREYGLRLRMGFWGNKVLAGADQHEVAKLGSEELGELLALRSPAAADFYASYRSRQKRATWLTWGGIAIWVTGIAIGDENAGAGLGLFVGGFTLSLVGIYKAGSALNDFFSAMWEYNSTLEGGTASP